MKKLQRIIGMFFMIGMPFPILFTDWDHQIWFTPLAYLSAFIGAGLTHGFDNYRTRPYHIGNFDEDGINPKINQTWMMFFISLIINLTVINLF
jgi:hypothetical protein